MASLSRLSILWQFFNEAKEGSLSAFCFSGLTGRKQEKDRKESRVPGVWERDMEKNE